MNKEKNYIAQWYGDRTANVVSEKKRQLCDKYKALFEKWNTPNAEILIDLIENDYESIFIDGLEHGINYPSCKKDSIDEQFKLTKFVKNHHFMFAFYFYDNDFGEEVKRLADNYIEDYNVLLHSELNRKNISYFEKLEVIKQYLIDGLYAYKFNNAQCISSSPTPVERTLKDIESYIETIGLKNDDSYCCGDTKKVREWLKEKHHMMIYGDEKDINNWDCNYEALVVELKNGHFSTKIC
jgi:hypothetical protein